MPKYVVNVTIENKPGLSDPEGDTILNDLVLKGTHSSVSKISTAKVLRFVINEKNSDDAKDTVKKICDELRIYNPMVSKIIISSSIYEREL